MSKNNGICETQSQFQKKLETIRKKCEETTQQIRLCLFTGSSVKMSNITIMGIFNDIYLLAEQSSQLNATKNKQSDKIENQLVDCFKKFLKDFILEIQQRVDESQKDKESILTIMCKTIHDYKAYSYWLYKMFFYLDKFAMPQRGASLCGTSLQILKEGFFDRNKSMILNTIQQFTYQTRKDRILLDKQIKQLIELFSVMGSKDADLKFFSQKGSYDYLPKQSQEAEQYFKTYFLQPLIYETEKFYKVEIDARSTFTTPEYVNWGNNIFQLELEMCRDCYQACEQGVQNKLIILLIKEQAATLINSKTGVSLMLQDDRQEELKSLYQFISKGKEVKHFAKAFQTYFEQQGMLINSINFDSQAGRQDGRQINPAELYFQKILEIMEKALAILKYQLNEDPEIQKSYSNAFSQVINKNERSPLWLAIYTDIIIRGEKGTNEIEMDKKLGKVVQLFQLLYQRDVFFKHYQKFLQLRLLNQQSQNLLLEKQLLQKFKGETGTNVLTQLQSMINDIEQSNRFILDKNFKKDTNFEFSVYLLSQGSWPINNIIDKINCPNDIDTALQIYQNAYLKEHSGRIVTWCYNLGQGEIVYRIQNEKYYLSANTLQIIAFMCFNQGDQFTIKQILEITNIDKIELENSLIPFICLKILQRQKSDIDDFQDGDEIIKINIAFNNKAKKMRMLPNPKMQPIRQKVKQDNGEEQQQMEQINKQREFVIDSQLVRLMKTKKIIKHHELVENCQQMITLFKPDVIFVKKRIENLIEREYIRRDEKDWNIYHYMN